MKILVTGAKGQLGSDVVRELNRRKETVIAVDLEEMDITDAAEVKKVIVGSGADAVIHCAAYTAVDAAEEQMEICRKVNVIGTENIARVCEACSMKLLYISTDYVFNGQGETPWQPDDTREPLNFYGRTKYEGELAVESFVSRFFIVRTSWAFGEKGNNFVKTMLRLAKTKDSLSVVADQIGSPTYTRDLAVLIADMIVTERYGRYHATNEGFCSWYEFACEIFRLSGGTDERKIKVIPIDSSQFPSKANRPKNSRMSKDKLTEQKFQRLPSWQNALARYLQTSVQEQNLT